MPSQAWLHSHNREPAINGKEDNLTTNKSNLSESEAKFLSRSLTSSGRRSRKTSSTSNRELIKILLEEKWDAERMQDQLDRAYGIIRAESRRVTLAEQTAVETSDRLRGANHARMAAQQEAARAKAELRLYKVQFENAQEQLKRANELILQSDLDRERAEHATEKMRRQVEKYREMEITRRAREEGRMEGREEASRELVAPVARTNLDNAVLPSLTQLDDQVEGTPRSRTVLDIPPEQLEQFVPSQPLPFPVQPPTPVTPIAQTNIPRTTVQPMHTSIPPSFDNPNIVPVPLSHAASPIAPSFSGERIVNRSIPDRNIVHSPSFQSDENAHLIRPDSRASVFTHPSYPASHVSSRPSHHIAPDPSQVYTVPPSSSSSESPEFPIRPLSRSSAAVNSLREHDRDLGRRTPVSLEFTGVPGAQSRTPNHFHMGSTGRPFGPLPQQEVIVPLPALVPHTRQPRPRPVSETYIRPRMGSSNSETSSSAFGSPHLSRVHQLRHEGRRFSNDSSIPGITIEPPSRPESVGTIMTATTQHLHLTPEYSPVPLPVPPPATSRHPHMNQNYAPSVPSSRVVPPFVPLDSESSSDMSMVAGVPDGITGLPSRPPVAISDPIPPGFMPNSIVPGLNQAIGSVSPDGRQTPTLHHSVITPRSASLSRPLSRASSVSHKAPAMFTTGTVAGTVDIGGNGSRASDYFAPGHHNQLYNAFSDPSTDSSSEQDAPGILADTLHQTSLDDRPVILPSSLRHLNDQERPSSRTSSHRFSILHHPSSPTRSIYSARRVALPDSVSSLGGDSRPASRQSRSIGHTPYRSLNMLQED